MDLAPGMPGTGSRRPRRVWYAVAALIAAGGVLAAAAVLFVATLGGDLDQHITPGRATAVRLPTAGTMVWTTADDLDAVEVRCEPAQGETSRLRGWGELMTRDADLTLDAAGRRWRGVLLMRAEPAGTYEVTCTMSGAPDGASLAVGDPPWLHDPASRTLAMLGAALLAAAGLVLGCVLAVVTAVRRRPGRGAGTW